MSDAAEREAKKARMEKEENTAVEEEVKEEEQVEETGYEAMSDEELIQRLKETDEERERLEELIARDSVKGVMGHMPSMMVNRSATTRVIPNEEAQRKVEEYRTAYTEYQNNLAKWKKSDESGTVAKPEPPKRLMFHEPAEIENRPLGDELFNFDVHVDNDRGFLIRSAIALKMSRSHTVALSHHNLTSPQDYLTDVLEDAMECCGFCGRIQVVKETTLFSLRPDLLVVLMEGRLLLAVDVRNPKKEKEGDTSSLFSHETVAGQTLDYLKACKQQGIACPLALLSTYNESVIATLSEDVEQYNEILSTASKNAKSEPSKRHKQGRPTGFDRTALCMYQRLASISASSSKDPVSQPLDMEDEVDGEDIKPSGVGSKGSGYEYQGRKVSFSQVFDVNSLFKAIVLLLESSVESFHRSQAKDYPLVPKEGGTLPNMELCTLYDDGYSYEKVPNVNATYNQAPKIPSLWKYHVLCEIGQGRQDKTFLCSSSGGKIFAVKIFLLVNASTQYGKIDEVKQDVLEKEKKEVEHECELWKQLAPQYQDYCHVITLDGRLAITMPYFPAVPLEERENALGPIEERLKEAAKKGWYYHGDGPKWRHFGCRWLGETMEITLLGLGSLRKEEENIDEQVERLLERKDDEGSVEVKAVLPPRTS